MTSEHGDLDINIEKIKAIPKGKAEKTVNELKGDILTLIHDASSGHAGGSLSLTRIIFAYYWAIHEKNKPNPHLSAGHCVPALYAIGHKFGNLSDEEMSKFRKIDGPSGHANGRVQSIPSGLLGQGAGVINGMARAEQLDVNAKIITHTRKIYGFFGDGEMDEPAIWGAVQKAGLFKFNLCYVINHNKKNLTGPLKGDFKHKIKAAESFGFKIYRSKNKFEDLIKTYKEVEKNDGPCMLVVDSIKGEGIKFMEEKACGWHGSSIDDNQYKEAMDHLKLKPKSFRNIEEEISADEEVDAAVSRLKDKYSYGIEKKPTRAANDVLAEIGKKDKKLVVLIPDIGKSVKTDKFADKFPDRHFDVGIDEGEAFLEAMGMAVKGYKPIVSTFDGFNYMILAQARIADYGNIPFLGVIMTHAEFIGEDGPTHLVTENLGAWTGMYEIKTIANPADILQAKDIIKKSIKNKGLFYVRLGRPSVHTIYNKRKLPEYGKADILMKGDDLTILTSGQEVWESLVAAKLLKQKGIHATVVNFAYFKPFDKEMIKKVCAGKDVFVVEAHNPEVGLSSMVSNVLSKKDIQIRGFNTFGVTGYVPSGTIEDQKELCNLTGKQIFERIIEKLDQI